MGEQRPVLARPASDDKSGIPGSPHGTDESGASLRPTPGTQPAQGSGAGWVTLVIDAEAMARAIEAMLKRECSQSYGGDCGMREHVEARRVVAAYRSSHPLKP